MKKLLSKAAAAALVLGAPMQANAGVYGDDLTRCVIRSASAKDQLTLVTFIFLAISEHPAVQPYTKATDAEREAQVRETAAIYDRLLLKDCRAEMLTALKYEGPNVIEAAFRVLGEVAMRGLMADPNVGARMASIGDQLDSAGFDALGAEAGLPMPKK